VRTESPDVDRHQDDYEPPRIESVLTSDELAREAQYAGGQSDADFIT
jgi:hypothetical protein